MLVVQIGASDGKIDAHRGIDEVYNGVTKHGWYAVLVEPNPRHFTELKENYANYTGQVIFKNCAIAERSGLMQFYDCPLQGASTLIESVLSRNNYHNGRAKGYSKISVNCITIHDLLQQLLTLPDYLVIDAEGYDGIILETLDLEKYPIPKIRFEFAHLEHRQEQQAQLGRVCLKLIKNGYTLVHDKADIIAAL